MYPFCSFIWLQIQAAFRTDEIRRTPPTPQDEMRAGMSYFHETIWKGVPKFLRRVDTALKNIGINERVPYNAPLIQFSSWMGGDRDGIITFETYFNIIYYADAGIYQYMFKYIFIIAINCFFHNFGGFIFFTIF